jgi:hypothetical protein
VKVPENSLPRDDLRATIEARRDLGPDYESALVESFLDRVEATIASRVRAEVDARLPHQQQAPGKPQGDPGVPIALGSLGIGIPLTAIAAGNAGVAGLFLAWGGIIIVNIAHALSRRRHR